jgi:Flp pilus assembly protein TadD
MAVLYEDRPRQVVPRWRLFDESLRRGELSPAGDAAFPRFTEEMVVGQLHDWKHRPSLSVASDFVSVALTLGLDRIAIDAAYFVHAAPTAPPVARSVAAFYLCNAGIDVPSEPSVAEDAFQEDTPITGKILAAADRQFIAQIHIIRNQLNVYPRNPVLWCNLALLYTSLGVLGKAERAMRAALWLAPPNRFILRAASRFFLHQGERERAHWLLAETTLLRIDPWILAAEIATADAMRKTSRWIKHARKILEVGQQPPSHLSELASALGTIELKAGKFKTGRRLINASLNDPSENSVAQAAWLSRNVVDINVPELQRSPEAYAWSTWRQRRWDASLDGSHKWLNDQPFSSRPAIHGSFIASTVYEDYAQALTFASLGLRSNPDDVTLLNNFAFASTMYGDVEEAEKKLNSIDARSLKPEQRSTYQATKGLIAFRSGNPGLGRSLYNEAIRLARAKQDEEREILAKIYLALEESRVGSPHAVSLRQEAADLASSRLVDPLGNALAERLKRFECSLNSNNS